MRSLRASPLLPVLLLLLLLHQQHQPSRAVHLQHARDAARPHGVRERGAAAGGAGAGGSGHILPTYMVHLYRNFKANASDAAEQDAERRADTVRSLMAKGMLLSNIFHDIPAKGRALYWGVGGGDARRAEGLQSTSHSG